MSENNFIKAKLKITLQAGETVVAISEDSVLWQKVFAAMTQSEANALPSFEASTAPAFPLEKSPQINTADPVVKFASQIGVTVEQVVGACSPSIEAPYINLDMHSWAAMRKKIAVKGIGSISDIAIVATILCYWFKTANIGTNPTIKDCQNVLDTISLGTTNATRSINNAAWLQLRTGAISINPTKSEHAISIVRTYCNPAEFSPIV